MLKILNLAPPSWRVTVAIKRAKEQGVKFQEVAEHPQSPFRITAEHLKALGLDVKKSSRPK